MYTMSTAKRAKMQEAASADMYDCRGHNPIMAISPTIAGDWFLRCYRLGLACLRRWHPLLVFSGAGFFPGLARSYRLSNVVSCQYCFVLGVCLIGKAWMKAVAYRPCTAVGSGLHWQNVMAYHIRG